MAQRNGTGMFPREVMNRFPLLPLEEEGRLNDLPLRENFIERVLPVEKHDRAYYRWMQMLEEEPTVPLSGRPRRRRKAPGGLVPVPAVRAGKFHTAHKLTLMAHGHWKAQWLGTTPRWPGGTPGPVSCRCGQAGLGRACRRVWGHAHGGAGCDGHAGQTRECAAAPDGLLEE